MNTKQLILHTLIIILAFCYFSGIAAGFDTGKPCSQAESPSSVNGAGSTFEIKYTCYDTYGDEVCGSDSSGSGLYRVDLYVKAPGHTEYDLAGVDIEDAIDGSLPYIASDTGEYFFYTLAMDMATNIEEPPLRGYDTKTVCVPDFPGYFILAVGSVYGEEGIEAHTLTGNNVYSHLINRGFVPDNIRYFNPNPETQTGEEDYSEIGYQWAMREAVTQWAPDQMKKAPGPLYITLINHGLPDMFHLTGITPLYARELDAWLDELQENLRTENIEQPIVIIIGASYSGSFIDNLSDPGRIIITSAADDEPSYRGTRDLYDVRDGEFFTSALFNELSMGNNLRTSFERAVEQTEAYTDSGKSDRPLPYSDTAKQHPLLDDNGDGAGTNDFSAGSDGGEAEYVFLGRESDNPGPVMVTEAGTIPSNLSDSDNQALLWVQVSDTERAQAVWVDIREPGMILEDSEGQQVLNLGGIFLHRNDAENRYEAVYSEFSLFGEHTLFFYAQDITGIISPFEKKYLYKIPKGDINKDGNADVADAISGLRLLCNADISGMSISTHADVNGDGKIGFSEVIFVLQNAAEL
ncbi:C13 family peptidase [Desulfococcaceae bacterium HSG8]|nr:C13 family peptidase [Desulfococcaceae bacterium HSG8]